MPNGSRRNHIVLQREELSAHLHNLPKSRHGHVFALDPMPPRFHTIVDPNKHPPQPWHDLPPAPGLPPYRLNIEAILDAYTLRSIEQSGKLVFHALGDMGGVNTLRKSRSAAAASRLNFLEDFDVLKMAQAFKGRFGAISCIAPLVEKQGLRVGAK